MDQEKELQWDDTIEKESDFILLQEGDYDFMVESFERVRHNGSEKIPPCNKAVLKLRIDSPKGTAYITHNLYLHTSREWLLSAFFTSIGQKKKGEPLRMNWNQVPGSTGRAKVGIHTYNEKEYNEIRMFYPKEYAGPSFKAGEF